MLAYALARLRWRFARPRVYAVIVVRAADPLLPWRRAGGELQERIDAL